jgi:Domain of unknown function (DUF5615)
MRFLVDAQLPPALARWLAAQGHEAEHVSDCGLARAADPAVWDYATSVDAIIVTKDEDFCARDTRLGRLRSGGLSIAGRVGFQEIGGGFAASGKSLDCLGVQRLQCLLLVLQVLR